MRQTVIITEAPQLFLSTTHKTLTSIPLSMLTPHSKGVFGITSMDCNLTDPLPITNSAFSQIFQNKWESYVALGRLQGIPHIVSKEILYIRIIIIESDKNTNFFLFNPLNAELTFGDGFFFSNFSTPCI